MEGKTDKTDRKKVIDEIDFLIVVLSVTLLSQEDFQEHIAAKLSCLPVST